MGAQQGKETRCGSGSSVSSTRGKPAKHYQRSKASSKESRSSLAAGNVFTEHNEALLQSRPLPQIPDISDDIRNLPPPLDGSSRWMSKENLLSQDENDPQLFVALYDFQSGGENQLSLRKACTTSGSHLNLPSGSLSNRWLTPKCPDGWCVPSVIHVAHTWICHWTVPYKFSYCALVSHFRSIKQSILGAAARWKETQF
ncbi:hypothetical protein AVEN_226365-1 [Araneus ventricosus]|uniref:Uncharacterized protein n=1 Tax=Araneus ventricosus TaxID=182803 RepID=A0A4Y2S9C8_ARAVE|nr:hypothetical protein AVEN_3383-1 [Araneus ventricosus]GBN84660.1 hypothetical protein AVEN_226365-1 [Araneus ventricosus]